MRGKMIIFCDDFRQFLSAVPFGSKGQIIEFCIKVVGYGVHSVCQNMRAHVNAGAFANWSRKLDNGEIRCLHGLSFIEISAKFVSV